MQIELADGFVRRLLHSPIKNYAIPGLTSYRIGEASEFGSVRYFICEREHQEAITPHSHRYSFNCSVIKGQVRQIWWTQNSGPKGDGFIIATQKYLGTPGQYALKYDDTVTQWAPHEVIFKEGQTYGMTCHEVHSIYFSKGAEVLFWEGPRVQEESIALLTYSHGHMIDSLKPVPWAFLGDE